LEDADDITKWLNSGNTKINNRNQDVQSYSHIPGKFVMLIIPGS